MAAFLILEFGKIAIFWSRDLYLRVIRHLHSEFHVNPPIRRRNIAKTIFNMASVRHLEFEKFRFFQIAILGMEICISVPNLIEIG